MKLKNCIVIGGCFTLLLLTAGCATFNEMVRQRSEAMDACQPCPPGQVAQPCSCAKVNCK